MNVYSEHTNVCFPQGIKSHPWYTGPLHPALSASLKQQQEEQAVRDGLRRATVSTTAMSHDTQNMAGDFQMIDLLVDMAQKHRWVLIDWECLSLASLLIS